MTRIHPHTKPYIVQFFVVKNEEAIGAKKSKPPTKRSSIHAICCEMVYLKLCIAWRFSHMAMQQSKRIARVSELGEIAFQIEASKAIIPAALVIAWNEVAKNNTFNFVDSIIRANSCTN